VHSHQCQKLFSITKQAPGAVTWDKRSWHPQFNHSMWSEYQIFVSKSNNSPAEMLEVSNYLKSEQQRHPAKRIIVLRQTICTDQFGMCPAAGVFTQKDFQTWQKEEQPINHSTGHKGRIPKGCELYTNDLTWPGHRGLHSQNIFQ